MLAVYMIGDTERQLTLIGFKHCFKFLCPFMQTCSFDPKNFLPPAVLVSHQIDIYNAKDLYKPWWKDGSS